MGDLTKNFNRREFACRCGCGFDDISPELVEILQQGRNHFKAKCFINSGCRCEKHNTNVGGSTRSQHKFGTAADIVFSGVDPSDVADFFESIMDAGGIGRYKTFTHVDVRENRARWRG